MVHPGHDYRRKTLSADKVSCLIRDAPVRETVVLRQAWSRLPPRNFVSWQVFFIEVMRKNSQPLGPLIAHPGHDYRRKPCQPTRFPPSGMRRFVAGRDIDTALYTRVRTLEGCGRPAKEGGWLPSTLLLGHIPPRPGPNQPQGAKQVPCFR